MRFAAIVLSVLALFAFSGAAHARKAPLTDPAPVSIPAGLDQEQVTKDIKRALIGRGWAIEQEQPGDITTVLHLRDHVARVHVTWDAGTIRIAYVDSTNLNYEDRRGKRFIHPNYLGWVNNIAQDMKTNLQLTALDK